MTPTPITVAPLAQHLPGALLVLLYLAVVGIFTAVPLGHIATLTKKDHSS